MKNCVNIVEERSCDFSNMLLMCFHEYSQPDSTDITTFNQLLCISRSSEDLVLVLLVLLIQKKYLSRFEEDPLKPT